MGLRGGGGGRELMNGASHCLALQNSMSNSGLGNNTALAHNVLGLLQNNMASFQGGGEHQGDRDPCRRRRRFWRAWGGWHLLSYTRVHSSAHTPCSHLLLPT